MLVIEVDQHHIDCGDQGRASSCPIALCLNENFTEINEQLLEEEQYKDILVYGGHVVFGDHTFSNSAQIQNWISVFDEDPTEVKPISLEIDCETIRMVNPS